MEYKEKRFEQDIETTLLNSIGYSKGDETTFDKHQGINLPVLIEYIKDTQNNAWKKYEKMYGENSGKMLLKRLNEEIDAHGLIHVLRNSVSDRGVKFKICHFQPESTLNTQLVEAYQKNRLTVSRQFAYSAYNNNTIDLVISLNGIPIIAIELKNQITGQTVEDGKFQFIHNRDPKELCFHFNKRFLVYFAVDLYDIFMTTHLKGKNTFFLPFNQGSNGAGQVGGSGNPENQTGYNTSYLWEEVLQKDSLLNIIQRFLHVEVEKEKIFKDGMDKIISKEKIIFPRYHQLDVVTKLINHVKDNGSGHHYLIQHSAGSGKSNSIAWTCYRLASLHDSHNEPVFHSVIVVTDRRVLDNQLQNTISSFDHALGLVETIGEGKTSKDLRDAINDGKKIIVTTLQKFPVIYQEVENNKGRRFAVIVDEAHSSQTGSSAQKLKAALADSEQALKEFEEFESQEEASREDFEDKMIKEMASHGKHDNLSFLAFTATPKQKTLEMFGQLRSDGHYEPFHVYSMRQAIEEGFILDVLENYMTYKTSYKIAKQTPDNPNLPESKAKKTIQRFESLHAYSINQKTAIMIEYFRDVTRHKINGRAKAMVVTPSRLHAVRYFLEFKRYIEKMGYDDLDVLVAFSGSVKDGEAEYTEPGLNKTKDGHRINEKQLPESFSGEDFHMLVVAEKYQTGFDEPLLHTMFVLKKLKGVKAVQTLSRLNRTTKGKHDTFILDFVNTGEEIQESFAPFYDKTVLDEPININLIYDTKTMLRKSALYNDDDVKAFNRIYYKTKPQSEKDLGRITSLFTPIINNYKKISEDNQFEFKKGVRNFVKWYAYITQIARLFDKDLQQEYVFLKYLDKLLPNKISEKVDLEGKVALEYYKLEEDFKGDLSLKEKKPGEGQLENPKTISAKPIDERTELLENIIYQINQRYNGMFSEGDKVMLDILSHRATTNNKKLKTYAKKNNEDVFIDSIFPRYFDDAAQDCYSEQMESFKKLFEDKAFYNAVRKEMAREVYRSLRNR